MRKFLKEVVFFGALLLVLSIIYYKVCISVLEKYGMPTEKQIRVQYQNFEREKDSITTLILGNSRLYRGINPYKFSGFAYNMSQDNDTYNQIYYKLEDALLDCPRLDCIVIGYDYFQFSFFSDTRNYVYSQFLPKEYLSDYGFSPVPEKLQPYIFFLRNNRFYIGKMLRAIVTKESRGLLSDRGQYIYDNKAKPNDYVERNTEILDIQDKYFNRIVSLVGNTKYKVFFVTLPIRDNEFNNYSKETIEEYNRKIYEVCNQYNNIYYINTSRTKDFLDYNYFQDITHLNAETADRYSQYLNQVIQNIINSDSKSQFVTQ